MGKEMGSEDFVGRSERAVAEALGGKSRGAILEGSLSDGKEAAAKRGIEAAGASYWSIDLAGAIGGGAEESQALAALNGSLARKSLHESLADPDDWGSGQEPGLPRAILVSGLEALSPEAAEKALAWGGKAAAAGSVPVFLSSGPLDCEAPEGFSVVSDGKSKSLLSIGGGGFEAPAADWSAEDPEDTEAEEAPRRVPGARR